MRILTIFGTRPEAIKLFPLIRRLSNTAGVTSLVCVTAQHRGLLDQILEPFGIRPDVDLDVMRERQDLTHITTAVLHGLRDVIAELRPDRVLVQGDTTTAMAAALAAFYAKVPVGHVEAGLRTGDVMAPWPEEMNRRLATVLADLHFAPTEGARANLLREGVPDARILVTGNTVVDALLDALDLLDRNQGQARAVQALLPSLDPAKRMILVTGHRRENFAGGLERVAGGLRRLADRGDVDIIYPVHPNPNVQEPVKALLGGHPAVHLLPPLEYLPFVTLMRGATLIVTDSGGIQEEAPSLGKPVLVTRDITERPEAVQAGTVELVGTDADRLFSRASRLLDDPQAYAAMSVAHNPYGDGQAARRIVEALAHA